MKNQTNKRYEYKKYIISRGNLLNQTGSYTDDDARRWYVNDGPAMPEGNEFVDYRGSRFATVRDAKDWINRGLKNAGVL